MTDDTDLLDQAEAALARRDLLTALALLDRAEALVGPSLRSRMARANALRAVGDAAGALRALDSVLATEPYHFMALLTKAVVLEQAAMGGPLPDETSFPPRDAEGAKIEHLQPSRGKPKP